MSGHSNTSPTSRPFTLQASDGQARFGTFQTEHGSFQTPAFMPVGTQGTVKGATPDDLRALGAEIVLSNTYHLHLRPGDELIKRLGGLHTFMGWDGPILTDSGGYQVFSLGKIRKIEEAGVTFQSHLDGTPVHFSPESVVKIQENLGVDIMMVLDECLAYPATELETLHSMERTIRWAKRCKEARERQGNFLFGIVQGGMFSELRRQCAARLVEIGFDGYAVGGLSVGEPQALMLEMTEHALENLPADCIRYLMGVGTPQDIVEAVYRGIDLFDCVIPTRSARFGRLYVKTGSINIRNQQYRQDPAPIEEGCDCYTCTRFSRAYVAHLTHAKEVLAVQLATLHNLRFYQRLMGDIRRAIRERRYSIFRENFLNSIKSASRDGAEGEEAELGAGRDVEVN